MACDKERFNRFFHAMLDAGVYLAPSAFEAGFVSAAHSDDDIAATDRCGVEGVESASRPTYRNHSPAPPVSRRGQPHDPRPSARPLPYGDNAAMKRRADATSAAADAKKSFCDEGFRSFPEVGVVKSCPNFEQRNSRIHRGRIGHQTPRRNPDRTRQARRREPRARASTAAGQRREARGAAGDGGPVAHSAMSPTRRPQLSLPLVDASGYPEFPILEERVSARFLRESRALPVREDETELALAMADPTDAYTIGAFEMVTGRAVRPLVAIPTELESALERLYGSGRSAQSRLSATSRRASTSSPSTPMSSS